MIIIMISQGLIFNDFVVASLQQQAGKHHTEASPLFVGWSSRRGWVARKSQRRRTTTSSSAAASSTQTSAFTKTFQLPTQISWRSFDRRRTRTHRGNVDNDDQWTVSGRVSRNVDAPVSCWKSPPQPVGEISFFCRRKQISIHLYARTQQKERAMLRVIEYFAKSLKIAQDHSVSFKMSSLSGASVSPYTCFIVTVSRTVSEIFSIK